MNVDFSDQNGSHSLRLLIYAFFHRVFLEKKQERVQKQLINE